MKTTRLLLPVILLNLFFVQLAVSQDINDDISAHEKDIEEIRSAIDQQMRDTENSPLSSEQLATFEGLDYYRVDINYRVKATFEAEEPGTEVSLNTTSGDKIKLMKVGTVTFKLNGKSYSLSVFRSNNFLEYSNPQQWFIPFTDKTNGSETNEHGRYLAVSQPTQENEMILDFNKARNPFNAYSRIVSSVIPPAKNSMTQTVAAGERKYEDRMN